MSYFKTLRVYKELEQMYGVNAQMNSTVDISDSKDYSSLFKKTFIWHFMNVDKVQLRILPIH